MKAVFYGVGVGPGDPELLTVKALRAIEKCPVIATPQTKSGATLALDIVRQVADVSGKHILPLYFVMSRDKELLDESHRNAAETIIVELEKGNDVAMLNLGDVSIYATFNYVKPFVEEAGFEVELIPGIPTLSAVAATLKKNLTPEMNTPFHVVPAGFEDLKQALHLPGTKIIMKAGKPLAQVKQTLREEGMYEKASLVQNCGLPDERIAFSLDDAEENEGYFTTMVVTP